MRKVISILLAVFYGVTMAMNVTVHTDVNDMLSIIAISMAQLNNGTPKTVVPFHVVAHGYSQGPNRKERRAQGERSFSDMRTQNAKVQHFSDTIDRECFHYKNRFFDPYVRPVAATLALKFLPQYALMNTLTLLSDHIDQVETQTEFDMLIEKNNNVNNLIYYFVNTYVDHFGMYRFFTGSTIDNLFAFDTMFPVLNSYLDVYLSNQIKMKYKSQTEARGSYTIKSLFFDKGDRDAFLIFPELTVLFYAMRYREIHRTIVDFEWIVPIKTCHSSADGNYIKCTDMKKASVVVDLVEGRQIQEAPKGTAWAAMGKLGDFAETSNISTDSFESIFYNGRFALHGKYYVRIIPTGTVSDSVIIYSKPTFLSRLCQTALGNSIGNKTELNTLLNSKMMAQLSGFVKKNLQRIIDSEISKIDS